MHIKFIFNKFNLFVKPNIHSTFGHKSEFLYLHIFRCTQLLIVLLVLKTLNKTTKNKRPNSTVWIVQNTLCCVLRLPSNVVISARDRSAVFLCLAYHPTTNFVCWEDFFIVSYLLIGIVAEKNIFSSFGRFL